MDGNEQDYLSEPKAARIGAISPHTLRKWRQTGDGPPFIRVSARCIRYRRDDFLHWLEARRVIPARPEQTR